jgi:hypothetical protein
MFADDVAFVDLDKARVVARTNVGSLPNGISFSTRSLSAEVHPRMDLDGGDMPRMSHDEGAVH